jgi:hypothetical protein
MVDADEIQGLNVVFAASQFLLQKLCKGTVRHP